MGPGAPALAVVLLAAWPPCAPGAARCGARVLKRGDKLKARLVEPVLARRDVSSARARQRGWDRAGLLEDYGELVCPILDPIYARHLWDELRPYPKCRAFVEGLAQGGAEGSGAALPPLTLSFNGGYQGAEAMQAQLRRDVALPGWATRLLGSDERQTYTQWTLSFGPNGTGIQMHGTHPRTVVAVLEDALERLRQAAGPGDPALYWQLGPGQLLPGRSWDEGLWQRALREVPGAVECVQAKLVLSRKFCRKGFSSHAKWKKIARVDGAPLEGPRSRPTPECKLLSRALLGSSGAQRGPAGTKRQIHITAVPGATEQASKRPRAARHVPKKHLLSAGVCLGKFTHSRKFRLTITALDYLARLAQYRVWLKPTGEQHFVYGNHVVKAHLRRITEGAPRNAGVVVLNEAPGGARRGRRRRRRRGREAVPEADVPIGFGVTAKSTEECQDAGAEALVVYHQADVGEYLREEDRARFSQGSSRSQPCARPMGRPTARGWRGHSSPSRRPSDALAPAQG
ncbi:unnamed protein product [Prorocentrum cordatum]|uniref:PUA domain-containing protein n=1 Tax=Prorocentrum cordatum TaxID=2364126 RepID=A0ABN9S8Y6_9DINO|nr:unnamed protein product [Polarella glacialis]